MHREVIWSPKAIFSLNKLLEFLIYKWGKKPTQELLAEIDKTLILIADKPLMYPVFSNKKNLRKCVLKGKTLLLYRIEPKKIELVLFVDTRQNPKKYQL